MELALSLRHAAVQPARSSVFYMFLMPDVKLISHWKYFGGTFDLPLVLQCC